MQIYLSCSKTMTSEVPAVNYACSEPFFLDRAMKIAGSLASYSVAELQNILKTNLKIAQQTRLNYLDMLTGRNTSAAIFTYTGTAYRALDAASLSPAQIDSLNHRLVMGSFLYGLLRPLDCIHIYRLEGKVELEATGHRSLFDFWRPLLTDRFIEMVKADDGVLVNLASQELQKILDWKAVTRELKVVTPQFKVQYDSKPVTVSLYAKMCRGAMTRWIVENGINDPDELRAFTYRGFSYHADSTFLLNE